MDTFVPADLDWDALFEACQAQPNPKRRERMEKFLRALEHLPKLGRVATCERANLPRPTFNRWYTVFMAGGRNPEVLLALANGSPHPYSTEPVIKSRIHELGQPHRGLTVEEIVATIREEFPYPPYFVPSETTIRKILRDAKLARDGRKRRRPALAPAPLDWKANAPEERIEETVSISSVTDHVQLGSSLVQSHFFVRVGAPEHLQTKGVPRVLSGTLYVHAVIDSQSGFVWAAFHRRKDGNDAVELLEQVCAFYKKRGLAPTQVTTGDRLEYRKRRGKRAGHSKRHLSYSEFLESQGIRRLPSPAKPPRGDRRLYTSAFNDRFQVFADAVRDNFFTPWREYQKFLESQGKPLDDLETLRAHLNAWVEHYNASLDTDR